MQAVLSQIGDAFGEESVTILKNELQQKIKYFQDRIRIIKNNINLKMTISSKGNKHYFLQDYSEKENLMKEAYSLIFDFRHFLTGETINYRYYYNLPDGRAGVVSFSEADLLKYVKGGKYGLRISSSMIMAALKDNKLFNDNEYQKLLDIHYNNIMNSMSPEGNFYVVKDKILKKYGRENPSLYKKRKNKKDNSQIPQVFTRGHIFEAVDKALSQTIQLEKTVKVSKQKVKKLTLKELNYDSIIGSRGGDNRYTNTQIKANQADLMDYYTIMRLLNDIDEIISTNAEIGSIKEIVKKDFLDAEGGKTQKDLEESVEKISKQLISLLT